MLTKAVEENMALIAERELGNWVVFSERNPPRPTMDEFFDLILGQHRASSAEKDIQSEKRQCLFGNLVQADARIAPEDDERLRALCKALREEGAWRGDKDFCERLEREVTRTFAEKPLSAFRTQVLAERLSDLFMGYRS